MNILEQQKALESFSDQELLNEAKTPTGGLPPYLVVSEVQRRKDFRGRFAATQAQKTANMPPVAQRAIAEFEGIAGADPNLQQNMPMGPNDEPSPANTYSAPPKPVAPDAGIGSLPRMAAGGVVRGYDGGGGVDLSKTPQELAMEARGYSIQTDKDGKRFFVSPYGTIESVDAHKARKTREIDKLGRPEVETLGPPSLALGKLGYIPPTRTAAPAPALAAGVSSFTRAPPEPGADASAEKSSAPAFTGPNWKSLTPPTIAESGIPFDKYGDDLSGILGVDPEAREKERHAMAMTQLGAAIANASRPGMIAAALPGIAGDLKASRREETQDRVAAAKASMEMQIAKRADQLATVTANREQAVLTATREAAMNMFEMNKSELSVRLIEAQNAGDRNRSENLKLLMQILSMPERFGPDEVKDAQTRLIEEMGLNKKKAPASGGQQVGVGTLR